MHSRRSWTHAVSNPPHHTLQGALHYHKRAFQFQCSSLKNSDCDLMCGMSIDGEDSMDEEEFVAMLS